MNFQLVYSRRARLGVNRLRRGTREKRAMRLSVLFTFLLLTTNALGVQLLLSNFLQNTEESMWNAVHKNGLEFQPKPMKNGARENSVSEEWKYIDSDSSSSESSDNYSDEEGVPYQATDKTLSDPVEQPLPDSVMATNKAVSVLPLEDTPSQFHKLFLGFQYTLATIGVVIGFFLVIVLMSHIFRLVRLSYIQHHAIPRIPVPRVNRLNTLPLPTVRVDSPELGMPNNEDGPVYYIKAEPGVGADRDPSVEGPTLTLLSLFGTTPFGTPNLHSELELCPGVPPIGSLHGTGSEGTTPYPFTAVPSNAPIGVTPGSDSNREWRLGVTNGVVPNNDSKVRVGPSTDGSWKAIKAKKRFITGSNHHRHEAPNPVPIMSRKFPYPPT